MKQKKKVVLVTGACGFLGSHVCKKLAEHHFVIGLDVELPTVKTDKIETVKGDITRPEQIKKILEKYKPEVIVHCAGIAHRKASREQYDLVNNIATECLSSVASVLKPDIHFILLSTISVYGEKHRGRPVKETNECLPTSFYAKSKLNAEKSLIKIQEMKKTQRLDILRLASVYDENWTLNLDKRVFGPKKLFFVQYGTGRQRMSVLARDNLADFIKFLIRDSWPKYGYRVLNVCDKEPVSFQDIIMGLRQKRAYRKKVTLFIPLLLIQVILSAAEFFWGRNRGMIRSYYDKIANNLIYDNQKMLDTGFMPRSSFKELFF